MIDNHASKINLLASAVYRQDFRLTVLANKVKVLINHITNTPRPHPSDGEVLSPLVGGGADM